MKICPKCKSSNITLFIGGQTGQYKCKDCGYVGVLVIEKNDFKKKKKSKK
jgi:transposase-like protein